MECGDDHKEREAQKGSCNLTGLIIVRGDLRVGKRKKRVQDDEDDEQLFL